MSLPANPEQGRGPRLGKIGIWSAELRFAGAETGLALTQELEAQGWPTAWAPGGVDDKILDDIDRLLSSTTTIAFATGILNLWKFDPAEVGAWWRGQPADRQARVMIGVGVSHAQNIGDAYERPIQTMRDYLQRLLEAGLPREHLCVAALGPKMLELSAVLTAGAHPYLVPPEHTEGARRIMGPGPLLAPEQGVILETDPARARALGRQALATYLRLPNYLNSWRRLGFSEDDVSTPSDRLIDALFAWGDVAAIGARIKAHLDAGADHVCVQVVTGPMLKDIARTRAVWAELASALL